MDNRSSAYQTLEQKFIDQVGREPNEYHLYGYELIQHIGRLLEKHGKYFQRGLINGSYYPGYMMEGLQYGPYRDNQIVPINTLENLILKNQNTKQEVKAPNEYIDE